MRDTGVSSHNVPIRATPSFYWQTYPRSYRPALNISLLLHLLKDRIDAPNPLQEVNEKGKKPGLLRRLLSSRDESPRKDPGKGKKRAGSSGEHDDTKRKKHNDGTKEGASVMKYPTVPFHASSQPSNATPAFHHTFSIHYSTASSTPSGTAVPQEPRVWDGEDWIDEEEALVDALGPFDAPSSSSDAIDLGAVPVAMYAGKMVVGADGAHGDKEWLLLLPSASGEDDVAPLLQNAHYLLTKGKMSVTGSLKLVRLAPDTSQGASLLPFRLDAEILFSFTPSFLDPVYTEVTTKGVTKRWYDNVLYSAQERLVRRLYFPNTPSAAITIPFLYSVLQPAPPLPSSELVEAMQPSELMPTLLPFQRRSLAWLLNREGKTITETGEVVPLENASEFTFWKRIDEGNLSFHFNRMTGEIAKDFTPEAPAFGGILAEEPGLGKTLEMISLVLLNPAPPERNPVDQVVWNQEAGVNVKAVRATLIVTPPALASQWMDELALHAPSLKVLRYEGWTKLGIPINAAQVEEERAKRIKANLKRKKQPQLDTENIVDWCTYAHEFDVVVTTYPELRSDLNVARPIPKRPRREDVVYSNLELPRSPLIMCEWHRVVMDEVQMVGGGKVEDMVSLIPRLSSFAVSGTPARTQVSDLIHVLKFLRVDDVVGSQKLWERLIEPENASLFTEFIQHYSIRTMKATLSKELTIPQQTRFLVPITMGRIERHVYDQALESVLLELGLDARGVAATADWEIDAGVLRQSLRRLRGICTHPLVGQLQKADRFYKAGQLRTIEEVLLGMQDQNWRNVMEDLKTKVQTKILQAQLRQHAKVNNQRAYRESLDMLIEAEKECTTLVDAINEEIVAHAARGEILKKEHAAEEASRESAEPEVSISKGKERESSPVSDFGTEEDGLPKTPAGEEHKNKRTALRNRLRDARIVLHRVKFLQGDVYNVLGESFEEEEKTAYGFCEELRRDLLKVTAEDANSGMAELDADATKHGINENTLMVKLPYLEQGGVRSSIMVEEFHDVVEIVLNEQSKLLWEWRSEMHRLLTQKLVTNNSGEGEADGQEYQRSLDDQGEAETYLQAYTSLLADRRQALVNERTLLAAHDAREKRLRKTFAAQKAIAADEIDIDDEHRDIELQPEHEVLRKQLLEQRKALLEDLDSRSIKSILVDMSGAFARIARDKDPEKILLRTLIADVRTFITDQSKALDRLDADLVLFRKAFNQRILYFRQLQEISDTVTQVSWEGQTYEEAVAECEQELKDLETSLKTSRARQRYMENLQKDRGEAEEDDDDDCILCGCEFERGFITACAHVFCEACMKAWVQKREGKVCPVCRVPIDTRNLQRFTVNAPAAEKGEAKKLEAKKNEAVPRSHRKIEYSMISPEVYEVIQSLDSFGDYGKKIQTIVRHLMYIQETDPGAKSIVFSAWADSLQILERALEHNAIGCLRIDQTAKGAPAAKRFKDNAHIQVLLLHGERENAGLNITCASRVFLLESVVEHGFEIQAIARIDRLGQTRPTEVYCYYTEDTIEKNILDMAARRGLSLYTKENSAGTLDISSLNKQDDDGAVDVSSKKARTKKQALKGDFISKVDDMLAILFPHMYEELEFLLPDVDGDVRMLETDAVENGNAVAGPSRLH